MQLLDRTQMPLERSRKRLHDLGWSALKTGQLRVTSVLFRAQLLGALIERALVADALDELISASFKLTVDLAQTPRDPDLLSRRRLGQAALALSPEIALTAMISGLIFYAAAYWLCLFALRSMPASVAGAFFNLVPIFGLGAAYVFLDERLASTQWVGASLVLLAVAGLMRLPVPPTRKAAEGL